MDVPSMSQSVAVMEAAVALMGGHGSASLPIKHGAEGRPGQPSRPWRCSQRAVMMSPQAGGLNTVRRRGGERGPWWTLRAVDDLHNTSLQ